MADTSLNEPVIIQAQQINASSLPAGLSPVYQRYILDQARDFSGLAQKANAAGSGAYEAQQKNAEQDALLKDHESRLQTAEQTLADHDQRITKAEADIADHETRITVAETELDDHELRLTQAETDISDIKWDYVSKSAASAQALLSPLGVATSLSINGVKVLGPRQTGWTQGTGTPNLGAFNADQAFTVGAAYSQAEVQAIANELVAARKRILALEQAMRTHGLID